MFFLVGHLDREDKADCFIVKPVYNDHSQKDEKLVFRFIYRLMHVKTGGFCNTFDLYQATICHKDLQTFSDHLFVRLTLYTGHSLQEVNILRPITVNSAVRKTFTAYSPDIHKKTAFP